MQGSRQQGAVQRIGNMRSKWEEGRDYHRRPRSAELQRKLLGVEAGDGTEVFWIPLKGGHTGAGLKRLLMWQSDDV